MLAFFKRRKMQSKVKACLRHIYMTPYTAKDAADDTAHELIDKPHKEYKQILYAVQIILDDWTQTKIHINKLGMSYKIDIPNKEDVVGYMTLFRDKELVEEMLEHFIKFNTKEINLI